MTPHGPVTRERLMETLERLVCSFNFSTHGRREYVTLDDPKCAHAVKELLYDLERFGLAEGVAQ